MRSAPVVLYLGKAFKLSLIFAGKARSFSRKYQTRLERFASEKNTLAYFASSSATKKSFKISVS
jgi:hypothetical protein